MNENSDILEYFEHPCSEQVRLYLRLEWLFARFHRNYNQKQRDTDHLALLTLFEVMDCASRVELKIDILKELERLKIAEQKNHNSCEHKIDEFAKTIIQLQSVQHKLGQVLRDNEWLMGIKQRMMTPGGMSAVDLPAYDFWQRQPAEQRHQDLETWFESFRPMSEAITLLMRVLRQQHHTIVDVAQNGSYQQTHMNKNIHLLRIGLAQPVRVIPEVSANQYLSYIRFIRPDFRHIRGHMDNENIPFRLHCCSFDAQVLETGA